MADAPPLCARRSYAIRRTAPAKRSRHAEGGAWEGRIQAHFVAGGTEQSADPPRTVFTMKPRIRINSPGLPALALESIDETHLDALRGWKNAFRHRFFHQDEISATRQREWYSGYLDRPD